MICFFECDKKKERIFFLFLMIIHFKTSFSKILDNFKLEENIDTGDLIYVKDYHNLNIAITTSKNIYTGIPPTLKTSFYDTGTTNYTNGITCNKNFVVMSCISGHFLKKINLKTGQISYPCGIDIEKKDNIKPCPMAIIRNSLFLMVSFLESNISNIFSTAIFEYEMEGMDDETNGPYRDSIPVIHNDEEHSISYISIDVDQQVAMESVSNYEDINDIHLVYFYVLPISEDGTTIYYVIGVIEQNYFLIFSLNIITDVKVYKLNDYTIRCVIKNRQKDLTIRKIDSEYELVDFPGSYKIFEESYINEPKVSVIILIYNMEKYLKEC